MNKNQRVFCVENMKQKQELEINHHLAHYC